MVKIEHNIPSGKGHGHRVFSIIILTFFLGLIPLSSLSGQFMVSVVNSLADDGNAHPWDDPDTPDIDESIDGVCEDMAHRCTLRAALEEASFMNAAARVTFSVTGNLNIDPLQSAFAPPDESLIQGIDQNVSIFGNGSNTPVLFGIGNHTLISGLHFTNALIGIVVGGNNNRIGLDNPRSANYISGMSQNGIVIAGDSNQVTGNVIGLDLLGKAEGSPFGVFVAGKDNVIGGKQPGEGNIISGNDKGIGVYTLDSLGGNTYIVGNFIGTDISGMTAIGNKVGIDNIGPNIFIGGADASEMNVISGNTESGILMGVQSFSSFISENHIGVDKTGNILIPNRDGITLGPGSSNSVVQSNLIKGNMQFGVFMSGLPDSSLDSRDHLLIDNTIVMNGTAGIGISNITHDVVIGSSLTDDYSPNIIQFNGQGGIVFSNSFGTPVNNTIRKNSFQRNNIKGINLQTNCSNCQNGISPPVIVEYADHGSGVAEIAGTHGRAGSIIDVYIGEINASGRYEGFAWLGSGIVGADHIFDFLVDFCGCDTVVATATDPQGNTSEFSNGQGVATSTEDHPSLQPNIQVFPNPFQSGVTIRFTLLNSQHVQLDIYDLSGRKVESLINEHLLPGMHESSWTPDGTSDGIYYYRLVMDSDPGITGKVVFVQ